MSPENAGVSSSKVTFCDLRCPHASFPKEGSVDGSGSCRTFLALYCNQLQEYVAKNAPCAVEFGQRRPKAGF
jgi:hypothetical protein